MAWGLYFSSSVFQVFDVGVVVVLSLCLSLIWRLRPCVRFRVCVTYIQCFDYYYYFIHFLDIWSHRKWDELRQNRNQSTNDHRWISLISFVFIIYLETIEIWLLSVNKTEPITKNSNKKIHRVYVWSVCLLIRNKSPRLWLLLLLLLLFLIWRNQFCFFWLIDFLLVLTFNWQTFVLFCISIEKNHERFEINNSLSIYMNMYKVFRLNLF